jgi:hypothetical protein
MAILAVCLSATSADLDFSSMPYDFDLKSMHRVTDKPHKMAIAVALLCSIPTGPEAKSPHRLYSDSAYCNVFVNDEAKQPLLEGEGVYPVGAYIVKQKLESADSTRGVLYTTMRKRESGYDPEHGDWEYAIRDGQGLVLAEGRIGSCIECHEAYKETDYVTREYLKP